MRIWSVHPRYLDRQGLVACWRETLLAQAVLAGRTKGYTRHPQLVRFRALDDPLDGIGVYLAELAVQADARGYKFDRTRVDRLPDSPSPDSPPLTVTAGQLAYEAAHLRAKLVARSPDHLAAVPLPDDPDPHPLFRAVSGPVADWEVR